MHELLNRRAPSIEVSASFWRDKRVAITGAAGTIGSALALRLARLGCARLGLLDSFDHGLIATADSIRRAAPHQALDEALGDIRDLPRTTAWLQAFQPDIVVHAAALKHVHLGERHPAPCVLTNLIGADNAMEAANAAGADRFILISSDKAADPVCLMGATKRLAELRLGGFQREHDSDMLLRAVRFGNVYGSQGSVIPRFLEQIEAGGPLELTHPDMERFFMSIEEAVDFILSVAALDRVEGEEGQAFFMDMGEPHSIKALGEELIRRSGKEIEIKITGMRPGERLNEILVDQHENVAPSSMQNIYRVAPRSTNAFVTQVDLVALKEDLLDLKDDTLRDTIFALLRDRVTGVERMRAPMRPGVRALADKAAAALVLVLLGGLAVAMTEMIPALKTLRYPGLTSFGILIVGFGSLYLIVKALWQRRDAPRIARGAGGLVMPGRSAVRARAPELVMGATLFVGGLLAVDWLNLL